MFWADQLCNEIEEHYADKIKKGEPLIIRDEKTCSGRVHVGSLRGVAIHGVLEEIFRERGIPAVFHFEINDFDPMDDVPPQHEKEFSRYLGQPLFTVPSPDGKAKNFAEFFGEEFISVIESLGFNVEFFRLHEQYQAGKFNDAIRRCLEQAEKIRQIYFEVSESEKPSDWLPLQVICPKCGKIGTTKVSDFDGETVGFECRKDLVNWAEGCGEKGRVSPFDGHAKLPWKVEWAAKFKVYGVDVEGAGKDHYTKGGSRDISRRICEEVLDYPNPFDIPYEFFNIGGKKMSSSKGKGSSAKEVSDLLPSEITRLLLLRKEPRRPVDFQPEGDTIPNLFDEFDRLSEIFFANEKDKEAFARIFRFCNLEKVRSHLQQMFLPRFREISFLVQMPHVDFFEKVGEMKGTKLTAPEQVEAEKRAEYARKWLEVWAPEEFIFQISEEIPEAVRSFTETDRQVCAEILEFMETQQKADGNTLHAFLHTLKEKLDVSPKEIFVPIYRSFFGRDSGPKAGFLLSVLDHEFVISRLQEVVDQKSAKQEDSTEYLDRKKEASPFFGKTFADGEKQLTFRIDAEVFENFPDLHVGLILARNIDNRGENAEVVKLLEKAQEEVRSRNTIETLSDDPKILSWRKAYTDFGAKKYKCSVENLYRMVLKNVGLRHINTVVDLYNSISLKHTIPLGGDDLDHIREYILLKYANGDEPFKQLGSEEISHPKSGEVVYTDADEVLCRRWNWRESEKSKMTEESKNISLVIEGLPPLTEADVFAIAHELAELVRKYCGGDVALFILNRKNSVVNCMF